MSKQKSGDFNEDMHGLTERQVNILEFIRKFIQNNGYPPSVREIGRAVGLSSSASIHNHLKKLEEIGHIQRDALKPRTLEIVEDAVLRQQTMLPISLVGQVTAGEPILAEQNIEVTYPLPAEFLGVNSSDDVFMLTIKGDSMINAGILDRDIVLVRQQKTANNGDIVVAFLEEDNEATVKRFFKEKDRIRLQPENDRLDPIYGVNISVLGKVIGVFRFL